MMIMNKWLAAIICLYSLVPRTVLANHQGLLQVGVVQGDDVMSYQYTGPGLLRYDTHNDGILLSQALVASRFDLSSSWSAHSVLNGYSDPKSTVGFSQAYLQYQPLSPEAVKYSLKVGAFYPQLSLENPDIGWTSPYSYSYSAINTWVGEEIRTLGVEASVKRSGHSVRSAHSFAAFAATFKGNDPAGTLLAWRGFALHDRQTTLNEQVEFARPDSLNFTQLSKQADHVEPFTEVDGRFGYYLGGHWDYLKRSQLRVYYYDNNGDPSALNERTGQYAWHTRFLSVAWLYKITAQTRVIAQLLNGKTAMGKELAVNNDFNSHFIMLSHKQAQHRLSIRYDYFHVADNDTSYFDPNQSRGEGLTTSWRYQFSKQWQVGIEVTVLRSTALYHQQQINTEKLTQQQLQINAQWRF